MYGSSLSFKRLTRGFEGSSIRSRTKLKALQYLGRIDDHFEIPVSVSSYFATTSAATSVQGGSFRGCSKWKGKLIKRKAQPLLSVGVLEPKRLKGG